MAEIGISNQPAAVWRTDWLASRPVFYNTKTNQVSHNVNDVVDFENIEFHPEGMKNYLDWGFSILEQTPLKDVKFLPPNAELRQAASGEIEISQFPDPVDDLLEYRLSESDIIDLLRERVVEWEKKNSGKIFLPISGGVDSRLLAYLMPDKSKLQAFTYGLSPKQEESFEVVYARDFCEKLGIQWQQIQLGGFHQYFDDWNAIFGMAIHAHGMYHIEFYKKLRQLPDFDCQHLLSGIVGIWTGGAGSILPESGLTNDIFYLRQDNSMHADSRFLKLNAGSELKEQYFQKNKDRLEDPRFRNIAAKRLKIIWLSYLLRLPEAYGFQTWSPYYDIDLAMAMLNLPADRRKDKQWVREFFQKAGLDWSQLSPPLRYKNTLNFQAIQANQPSPLQVIDYESFIDPAYVQWINRSLEKHGKLETQIWRFIGLPKINRLFKIVGIRDRRREAYLAYLMLKPFEYLQKNKMA